MPMSDNAPRILVVDDERTNLKVMHQVLQNDYRVSFATSGADALDLIERQRPDLILLDVMMPNMTGFEVCSHLKANPDTAAIPVIFVTALQDSVDETQGFDLGAVDYITKPITPAVVRARVRTHLSLVHVQELERTHLDLIQRLGRAAEYKDNETGMHILRMSHYAKIIALAYGLSPQRAEILRQAAPMHDIGKIGIPDHILLKPGKLTDAEFAVMRTHTAIGAELLGNSDSPLIQLACQVASDHHERWDGAGYPNGLKGDEISIEGRIVAVADVFDALTSKRPYKDAWSVDEALRYMEGQSGSHFDPALLPILTEQLPAILDIRERYADE